MTDESNRVMDTNPARSSLYALIKTNAHTHTHTQKSHTVLSTRDVSPPRSERGYHHEHGRRHHHHSPTRSDRGGYDRHYDRGGYGGYGGYYNGRDMSPDRWV